MKKPEIVDLSLYEDRPHVINVVKFHSSYAIEYDTGAIITLSYMDFDERFKKKKKWVPYENAGEVPFGKIMHPTSSGINFTICGAFIGVDGKLVIQARDKIRDPFIFSADRLVKEYYVDGHPAGKLEE